MKPFSTNEKIKAYLYLHQDIRSKDEAQDIIDTLEEMRPHWQNLRNCHFERVFPQVYIAYAIACLRLDDVDKAIEILEEAVSELSHNDFKYYFREKSVICDLLTRCYITKGKQEKADEVARESIKNQLFAFNNIHFADYEFYSFRAVSEHSLADLKNGTLSLCSPLMFNDPVDTALFPWLHYQKEIAKGKYRGKKLKIELDLLDTIERAYANLRARCLVRNIRVPQKEGREAAVPVDCEREYANTLMWAHYADFHKGFCVKYIFPSSLTHSEPEDDDLLILRPIEYVESFQLQNDMGFYKEGISNINAFLTKQKKWEYEHEHRLLYFNRKGSPDFPTPKLPEGSIRAVYIGVKTSATDRQKIINSLKDNPEVKIYQMQISSQDIYKLHAEEIIDRTYRPIEKDAMPFGKNSFFRKVSTSVSRICGWFVGK